MHHWTDPHSRGVYDHPAAVPPPPRPATQNDVPTRVARLEEHTHYAALDRARIERESRLRAQDITSWLDNMNMRLGVLEQDRHTSRRIRRMAWTIGTSAAAWLRYLLAAFLAVLLLTGKATIDQIKFLFGVLGLPGG